MKQNAHDIRTSNSTTSDAPQQGYQDSLPSISHEIDRYGQVGTQSDRLCWMQPLQSYRTMQNIPGWPSLPTPSHYHVLPPSAHRAGTSLLHQSQRNSTQPAYPYALVQGRPVRNLPQEPKYQLFPSNMSGMNTIVQRSVTEPVTRANQRNQLLCLHSLASNIPRSVSRSMAALGAASAQSNTGVFLPKKRSIHSSIGTSKPQPRTEQPFLMETVRPTAATQQGCTRQLGISNPRKATAPQPCLDALRPSFKDWTTYRVDSEGTRIAKTEAPPQGTYKISEGVSSTDYSDPRDFFAPSRQEQDHVWKALQPVRAAYYQLTHTQLQYGDMKTLSMGYTAAWEEIKRRLVQWIFENFSPDRNGVDRVTVPVLNLSNEIPGYTAEELKVIARRPYNPENVKYFIKGELAVNVDDLLPRLERWYGLIEDYHFSPSWPYERQSNCCGVLIQNPDCFACIPCRKSRVLCHGFRKRADRKCTPCTSAGLTCSIEEDIVENKLIRC